MFCVRLSFKVRSGLRTAGVGSHLVLKSRSKVRSGVLVGGCHKVPVGGVLQILVGGNLSVLVAGNLGRQSLGQLR